ncbi:MAG: YggS family pyridoxal phosphate-dependent enzyme [Acidobacteria bacterium]|nr:YggS family pyridoxal phosphate-dependent enzyme [Acidobacteriota bacterium]
MSGPALDAEIALNLDTVRRRLEGAAHRAHRSPNSLRLIAVSKTFPVEAVFAAARAGQRDFGENRVQEGLDKVAATAALGLTWHLIGHLQSNKAKKAAAAFHWIHSIDSIDLLKKVDAGAVDAGTRPQILLQVDLAEEATKFGADRNGVEDLARAALACRAVELRGLMTVPPIADDPEEARTWFRQLRDLRDALIARGLPAAALAELSMGMSHDCEVAVDEGATLVRVGTAIFGRRPPPVTPA